MTTQLIIERPELQAWQQKAVFGVLTAAFWVAWFFLWLPLITLIGWFFFGYQFHFYMIKLEGYAEFLNVLAIYALVIVGMGGSLILWAMYNHARFRGMDRRKHAPTPSNAEIGAWAKQPAHVITHWQNCNVVTVHHDEKGAIERVEPAMQVFSEGAPATEKAPGPALRRVV